MPHSSAQSASSTPIDVALPFFRLAADFGDQIRLAVTGELDMESAPAFEAALSRAQGEAAHVVVDLRALEFMDSSGLHTLLRAAGRARDAGGGLVVVRGPAQADRLFALTGADAQIEFTRA